METAASDPSLAVWPWVRRLSSLGFTWLLWAEGRWSRLSASKGYAVHLKSSHVGERDQERFEEHLKHN